MNASWVENDMIDVIVMAGLRITSLFPGGGVPRSNDGITFVTGREKMEAIKNPGERPVMTVVKVGVTLESVSNPWIRVPYLDILACNNTEFTRR